MISHTGSEIRSRFKPFSFSLDYAGRYGYEDDDAIFMMEDEEREDPIPPDIPPTLVTKADKLIASGLQSCEFWTAPKDDEEVAARKEHSTCWKDTHYRQIKSYLDCAEVDKTCRDLS